MVFDRLSRSFWSVKEFLILPFPLSEAADCVTCVTSVLCFPLTLFLRLNLFLCDEGNAADDGCVYTGGTFPCLHSVKLQSLSFLS